MQLIKEMLFFIFLLNVRHSLYTQAAYIHVSVVYIHSLIFVDDGCVTKFYLWQLSVYFLFAELLSCTDQFCHWRRCQRIIM
jgi:hypothetical protein